MIRILFRNIDPSDMLRETIEERLHPILDKFPDLKTHKVSLSIQMENSPFKAGADLFTLKMRINGDRYKELVLKKSSPNFYLALAEVHEHLLERLNRYGDRERVKNRKQVRTLRQTLQPAI